MKTDVIVVSSAGQQMETALKEAEKVSAYANLSRRNAMHLRLLTEEMMGMMRSITGQREGEFWIESDGDVYSLHLVVETWLTSTMRDQLLDASTSGKNESARTLMGWIRDMIDRGSDRDISPYTTPTMLPGMVDHYAPTAADWEWSLMEYQQELADSMPREEFAGAEEWDQLEKSVVAHVADDVKVSIRGRRAEMIIIKKMS